MVNFRGLALPEAGFLATFSGTVMGDGCFLFGGMYHTPELTDMTNANALNGPFRTTSLSRRLWPALCVLALALAGCNHARPTAQGDLLQVTPDAAAAAGYAYVTSQAPPTAGPEQLTVFITGANRGLGLEMARQFSEDGYFVIGTARRPDGADELAELGVRIEQLDVTDVESVAALAQRMGDHPVDILINSAGYYGSVPIPQTPHNIDQLDADEVLLCLNINTVGPLRVTQALLGNLRAGETRKVVNISTSQSMLTTRLRANNAYGYRVSKTGLNMLTRVLAGDLQDEGFIVVSLAPGWVQTDMGSDNARMTPEESIRQVKDVIENLTPEQTGGFWYYDGSPRKW